MEHAKRRERAGECAKWTLNEINRSAGIKILVVEDCKEVANIVSLVLRKSGYEVTHTNDGDEAVRLFALKGPYALLLTDIILPGRICGYEIAEILRQKKPGLPVIFFTGHPLGALVKEHGYSDDIHHLMKPAMISQIREAVVAALSARLDGDAVACNERIGQH